MKHRFPSLLAASAVILLAMGLSSPAVAGRWEKSPMRVGWAIGWDETDTAVILHTRNGGRSWQVQGDAGQWRGQPGNDISAVDYRTAWAAVGEVGGSAGKILHTTNGGRTWVPQILPEGIDSGIKAIKGLTRREAWAATYDGTILHTTDGGRHWRLVDPGFEIGQVNRIDAIGYRDIHPYWPWGIGSSDIHANVWIADEHSPNPGGLQWGMVHTLYNGEIWRQEYLPIEISGSGVHMVSAYSPRVVWATAWFDGTLYRTVDGGQNWEAIGGIGPNDVDDLCVYHADGAWLVQFQSSPTGGGVISHVRLENGVLQAEGFTPDLDYRYEGLTCFSDRAAVVVGYTDSDDPSLQRGIILATNDGGDNWQRQPLPVDGVRLWKVSFVGARR